MDLVTTARFFDDTSFDSYSPVTGLWTLNALKGQLKKADTFVSIWNRPTRKRMLYTQPGQEPKTSVIRVNGTVTSYLVGSSQPDFFGKARYRNVQSLHQALGRATIMRLDRYLTPSVIVERRSQGTAHTDFELRSVDEDVSRKSNHYGRYFCFLPSDSTVKKHDVLTLNGFEYYVIDLYVDSGFLAARVEQRRDERLILAYTELQSNTYNHNTQAVTEATAPHTVVARVASVANDQANNNDILSNYLRVLLDPYFTPGLVPKPNDKITVSGQVYVVESVRAEPNNTEFDLMVRL